MLIRIVRMTFKEDKVGDFLKLFDTHKATIRETEGCLHLELLKDLDSPNIFTTYSHWENESSLDHYRNSDFFDGIWLETKKLFSDAPIAFSAKKFLEV